MPDEPRPPSTLELLGTTPLRDALRGRLSGRLDIPAALADLNLPQEIESHLIASVERARIPALHRPVIAREIGLDAREWLDAGDPPEVILANWGSRRSTARLVRRRHDATFGASPGRRLRRFVWRRSRWALLSFAIFYAVAAARYWTGKPSINRNFAAEWNAPIHAIPEADRAWPLYVKVLEFRRRPDYFEPWWEDRDAPDWQAALPGDPIWPEVLRYLEWSREPLATIREAAARPSLGRPLTDGSDPDLVALGLEQARPASANPAVISLPLPQLGALRSSARWLGVDARAAAAEGDAERALADIVAIVGIAEQAREPRLTISELVSIAVYALAAGRTAELLADYPDLWSRDQLAVLADRFGGYRRGEAITLDIEPERAFLFDFIQRAYTDNGSGNGRITVAGMLELQRISASRVRGITPEMAIFGPLSAMAAPGRRALWAEWTSRLAIIEPQLAQPLWECNELSRGLFPPASSSRHRFYKLPDIVLPAIEKAYRGMEMANQERDAITALLAMHLYRADHGAFPDGLERLVPDYLPSLPLDRIDGAPLRYRFVEGRPTLYSLGQDGDDDGGVQAVVGDGPAPRHWLPPDVRRHAPDGDAVYWPHHRSPRDVRDRQPPVHELSDPGEPADGPA